MILEATAFGVASRILIGLESSLSCLDGMVHGTSETYMREWLAEGNRDRTTTEAEEGWATVGELAEDSSGGLDVGGEHL